MKPTVDWSKIIPEIFQFVAKYIFNPVLVGLILYGENILGGETGTRVAIALAILTTSYFFLASISRIPWIGCYTGMLTKVIYFKLRFP